MNDEELFATTDDEVEPAVGRPAAAREIGEAVIRGLLASGIRQPFGFDAEDAIEMWGAKLTHLPTVVVLRAVDVWISEAGSEWPTIAEFDTLARGLLADMRAEERERGVDRWETTVCPECNGHPQGFVDETPDAPGQHVVRPCSRCTPDRHRIWRAGCLMPGHDRCSTCRPAMARRAS